MAARRLAAPITLRLSAVMMDDIRRHLFRGDDSEHGGVLAASVVETDRGMRLIGRRWMPAADGVDFVPSPRGWRMLTAEFVLDSALACADDGLAYLAVHNHGGDDRVAFSSVDMESHQRGYPALVDILNGPPAGALVFATNAVAGDIWISARRQEILDTATVVGRTQQVLHPSPRRPPDADPTYDRQVRLFGDRGQYILARQKVAVVGVGGAGSLINEYLARLGVGHLVVIDDDRIEESNYPRIVGAKPKDLRPRWIPKRAAHMMRLHTALKVDIAERVAREANPGIRFEKMNRDVTDADVAENLVDCDAIFLAADTMRARLVVNAICHQYIIPVWQVGAKVVSDEVTGAVEDVFSVMRQLVPGQTCMWCNQLINPVRLAEEAAAPEQQRAQRYVDEVVAPSVITLNAVAAADAVNDYLFSTVTTLDIGDQPEWIRHQPREPRLIVEIPRQDDDCPECARRLGAGRLQRLPVKESNG